VFAPTLLSRSGTVLLDTARTDAENRWGWCFTGPETGRRGPSTGIPDGSAG
jgi:hypothetical protein